MSALALALAALLTAPARADDPPTDVVADEMIADDRAEPAPIALDAAQALRPISDEEMEWLEPKRSRLPQNPYGQTDFTAYTLEWGEIRVGLGRITVGVLPRTEVSTKPFLDALGVYNGAVKVNALRLGPGDLSFEASHHRLPLGEFLGYQSSFGGTASFRIIEPWSFHVSGSYSVLGAHGLPDLHQVSPVLTGLTGTDLWDYDISELAQGIDFSVRARTISAKVATDFRVNRRDSVILQGQANLWGGLMTDVDAPIPEIFGIDQVFDQDESGQIAIKSSYVTSVAWQFSWKRADLRLGVGTSSLPAAWLLQSTELSWRFGGKTRRDETRMRQGWRQNRKVLKLAEARARVEPSHEGAESGTR